MIDLSSRVQKLEELKSRGVNPDIQLLNWPQDIDAELKEGMMMAGREVLKTLQLIGMLPALVKGNILKEDGDDIICLNTPGLGSFAVWESPDENEVIASDELLDLDSEVLLTAIEEHCSSSSNALIDLAAATCLHQSEHVESEEEDEDSPTHCTLYKENKCKYNNSTFKPPKNTLWIGCNYPCCNVWYHEQCLSLQFAGDKEREDYTLVCPKHKDIKEHFRNKVTALSIDTNSLSDENISLQPMPKRLRLNKKSNVPRTIDYSIRPNYVEHEGQFYHIAEFLSLQEGKVYRPATSRLARWMESARNDFYEQVEKLFAPQRVETGTYLSDIVALWLPSEGLHVGLVIRIVRSP